MCVCKCAGLGSRCCNLCTRAVLSPGWVLREGAPVGAGLVAIEQGAMGRRGIDCTSGTGYANWLPYTHARTHTHTASPKHTFLH